MPARPLARRARRARRPQVNRHAGFRQGNRLPLPPPRVLQGPSGRARGSDRSPTPVLTEKTESNQRLNGTAIIDRSPVRVLTKS